MWLTSRSISTFEKYAISVSIRCSSNKDSCLYFSAACFIALAVISFAVDSVGNSRTLTCNVTSWWGGRQSTFKCKSTIQWYFRLPNERNERSHLHAFRMSFVSFSVFSMSSRRSLIIYSEVNPITGGLPTTDRPSTMNFTLEDSDRVILASVLSSNSGRKL